MFSDRRFFVKRNLAKKRAGGHSRFRIPPVISIREVILINTVIFEIMSIFSDIEKLITEHGSASILKERLALAADKYSTLESENETLKAENEALRLKLEKHEKVSKPLKDVAVVPAPILGALFDHGPSLTIEQIHDHTGMDINEIEHIYLDQLAKDDFLQVLPDSDGDSSLVEILPAGKAAWVKYKRDVAMFGGGRR
ncbi:hypothetical protein VSU19_13875 [Verrucomicrobiales bacterium BCK34]|nr:hypothetical protein [Verrucomicrobiales bacterium BCK34]